MIREYPVEFAKWFVHQQEAFREFGFSNPRRGSDILAGDKVVEGITRIANGENVGLTKKGHLTARFVKAISEAIDKRFIISGTPEAKAAKRKLERAAEKKAIAKTAERNEARREEGATPEVALQKNGKQNEGLAIELEKEYPGITAKINGELAGFNPAEPAPRVFEHLGDTFELIPDKKGNPHTLRLLEESGTPTKRMSEKEVETSEKAAELVDRANFRSHYRHGRRSGYGQSQQGHRNWPEGSS